jgi:hypothetical protein
MNEFRKEELKSRLLKLASRHGIGAPRELALKFEVSERFIKKMVSELRQTGTGIRYSKVLRSYVTGEGE